MILPVATEHQYNELKNKVLNRLISYNLRAKLKNTKMVNYQPSNILISMNL